MLLLEVLISVLIFSLALLGLVGLQARAIQFSVDAEDRNRASLMANEIVTTLWIKKSVDQNTDISTEISAWRAKLKDLSKGGLRDATGSIETKNGITTITINWKTENGATGATGSTTRSYATQTVIPPSGNYAF